MTEESTKNLNLQDSNPSLQTGEIIVYNPNDSIHLEVRMEHESVWLTQSQMGTLFGVDRTVIVKHIGNVYESGELDEISTCAIIAQVRKERSYNLDIENKKSRQVATFEMGLGSSCLERVVIPSNEVPLRRILLQR